MNSERRKEYRELLAKIPFPVPITPEEAIEVITTMKDMMVVLLDALDEAEKELETVKVLYGMALGRIELGDREIAIERRALKLACANTGRFGAKHKQSIESKIKYYRTQAQKELEVNGDDESWTKIKDGFPAKGECLCCGKPIKVKEASDG
jgi:hypothetical protein